MILRELLETYDFNELMPIITDMFPGTGKFRDLLRQAYDMLLSTHPAKSSKTITYKLMRNKEGGHTYMGAEDTDFRCSWQNALAKNVIRESGVDLTNIELAANSLINLCLISDCPPAFFPIRNELFNN